MKNAGITLSEYVMPGLGGVKHADAHAKATAEILNRIHPDFIRIRTLRVLPRTTLAGLSAASRYAYEEASTVALRPAM